MGRITRTSELTQRVTPCAKLWLEVGGQYVFGLGISEILKAVQQTGSIKAAAQQVGKSYRHVWDKIKQAEQALGVPLVRTQVGGKDARRSELSELRKISCATSMPSASDCSSWSRSSTCSVCRTRSGSIAASDPSRCHQQALRVKNQCRVGRQGRCSRTQSLSGSSKKLPQAAKHRSRNKWRKLPACGATIYRKLEAYATGKSDSYFSNGANWVGVGRAAAATLPTPTHLTHHVSVLSLSPVAEELVLTFIHYHFPITLVSGTTNLTETREPRSFAWLPNEETQSMNPAMNLDDTLNQLLELPAGQRAAVAHGLLVSLDDADSIPPGGDDWAAELDARLDAADREEYAEGDWRAVIARVRSAFAEAIR